MMNPSSRRDFLKNMMLLAGAAQIAHPRLLSAAAAAPPRRYVNIAPQAGIHFTHNNGAFGKKYLPRTMGSGCAFIDYDNDGWADIFIVDGTRLSGDPPDATNRLYRNNRDGTFTDVTARAGVSNPGGRCMGAVAADLNDDGWIDLYQSNDAMENYYY